MSYLKSRKKLARYIKKSRKNAGLSQREVSALLGLKSPQYISNCECNKNVISYKALKKLIRIYQMDRQKTFELALEIERQRLLEHLKI